MTVRHNNKIIIGLKKTHDKMGLAKEMGLGGDGLGETADGLWRGEVNVTGGSAVH